MTAARLTQAEFAVRMGITPGRVSQMKRSGLPIGADGRLDLDEAVSWCKLNLNPARRRVAQAPPAPANSDAVARASRSAHPPQAEGRTGDFNQARTLHEWRKIERLEIELAVAKGDLVPKAEAGRLLFEHARQIRDAWMGFASRIAPTLAAAADAGRGNRRRWRRGVRGAGSRDSHPSWRTGRAAAAQGVE